MNVADVLASAKQWFSLTWSKNVSSLKEFDISLLCFQIFVEPYESNQLKNLSLWIPVLYYAPTYAYVYHGLQTLTT
jgi:hypothetical protein